MLKTSKLQYRELVRTSKDLAVGLARLAEVIRARVNEVLSVEGERGELRKLYKAFHETLVQDLCEDDFADMYAQTIAYGLLSASIARQGGALLADDLKEILPNTNPFLKELMQTFLTAGGREGKIDFDELGIHRVVELLRHTQMDEVLKDFATRNPQEDPVIHFYELFLKEYDPKRRMQRGVFYTPRPVVSFVVRSVDEILRTEFGLGDGLADTTTWGELRRRHAGLNIPKGVRPDEPFVQILDPATGTGTFLVEVIERIHETMRAKWKREGKCEREMIGLWNDYVPRNLLPRMHGFELMMTPYVIAHMKVGLKLAETKYNFLSTERARIYLTNTLEEPKDFSGCIEQMELAHEAHAADLIKRGAPVTVLIGNPPYAGISGNMNPWIDGLLKGRLPGGTKVRSYYEVDGRPLGEKKLWLQDDYVKFMRYGQHRIDSSGAGVLGYITNHGYLNNPTFRGMRQQLLDTFPVMTIIDLHGNAKKKERAPDGSKDQNVFDIEQGVAVGLFSRTLTGDARKRVRHADVWGERSKKYRMLLDNSPTAFDLRIANPSKPYYFLIPINEARRQEYEAGWSLTNILPVYTSGIVTARDAFVIDFETDRLLGRIEDLREEKLSDSEVRAKYFAGKGSARYEEGDSRGWKLSEARRKTRSDAHWRERVEPILYRPFDVRNIYYAAWMIDWPRPEVMGHLRGRESLAFIFGRSNKSRFPDHFFCSNLISETKCGESTTQSYLSPLYIYPDASNEKISGAAQAETYLRRPNLAPQFVGELEAKLKLKFVDEPRGQRETFSPYEVFQYIYAVLYSPGYRKRYAEFLKIDFPRIPLTSDAELFRKLCALGADLLALHLLKDDYEAASWNASRPKGRSPLNTPITRFAGKGCAYVAKGHPKYIDGNVYISPTRYFEGVPAEVWSFRVGGYQVCEKWLKDRRGRTLSDEEVAHYQRIVVALDETIRLMAGIDQAIEEHGGWPLAGSQ